MVVLPERSDPKDELREGEEALLIALFEMFGIQHMEVSKQALREGLLYDLLGRIEHKDIRNQTIASLMERWQVDRGRGQGHGCLGRPSRLLLSFVCSTAHALKRDPEAIGG